MIQPKRAADRQDAAGPFTFQRLEPRALMGFDPFGISSSRVVLSTTDAYRTMVTTDIDADGDLDLIVSAGPRIYSLLNNGNAGYGAPRVFRITGEATQLVAADFDGDGRNDLAAFGVGAGTDKLLRVFRGNGDGTWARTATIKVNAQQILPGNFDTDTRRELVAVFTNSATIYQMNAGIPNAPRPVANSAFNIADAFVADMDFDGLSDVVVGLNSNSGDAEAVVSIWRTTTTGTSIGTVLSRTGAEVTSVSAGNVIGSSRPDVIIAGRNLDGLDITRHGVWVEEQFASGSSFIFSGPSVLVYGQSLTIVPIGESYDFDIDLAPTLNVNGDPAGNREIIFRWQRTIFDALAKPTLVTHQSFLGVATNFGAGSFDVTGSAFSSPRGDLRRTFTVGQYQPTASSLPDLLYVQLTDTVGGLNKVRFAQNLLKF